MEEVLRGNGLVVSKTKDGISIRKEDNESIGIHVKTIENGLSVRPRADDTISLKAISGVAIVRVTK